MSRRYVVCLMTMIMMFVVGALMAHADAGTEISTDRTITQIRDQSVTAASFTRNANGCAGKSADDAVQMMRLTDDGVSLPLGDEMINGSYPRYEITHNFGITSSTPPDTEATMQFGVYADGNVKVGCSLHSRDVLRWDEDGSLYSIAYPSDIGDWTQTFTKIAVLERGVWHTIALTFNSTTLEQKIYADGKFVASVIRPNYPFNTDGTPKHTTIRVGTYAGSGEGVVAIDDVYSYQGGYDEAAETVVIASDEAVYLDETTNTIIYNEEVFVDVSSLKNYLFEISDAKEIKICGTDFGEISNQLPQSGYCLIVPPSGIGLRSYKMQSLFSVSDINASSDGETVMVSATVTNNHPTAKNVTMIVSLRDKHGNLCRVYSSSTESVLGTLDFAVEDIEADGGSVYVFFIEDWNMMKPISTMLLNLTDNIH